jgi:phage terminase large subunit-like protein
VSGKDYVAIATEYAEQVVAGEIEACKWVRLACQRQLDDLQRAAVGWRFRFDHERANHVCRFIELLPHIEGKWAREGRLIVLEPWQIFILTTVFGWVNEQGFRRYRIAYIEVPRKNAKSTISAGVALYMLAADREPGAQVYSAATTRDQARIVWRTAKKMVEKTPGLQIRFGVETSVNSVYIEESSAFFQPLSRDQGGNHDGYNTHCGVVDELHAHKQRDIWDVLETSTGAREQSLIWGITTAGFNRTGICYEQRAYSIKQLERTATELDDSYFCIIFTIDEGDDWTDPRCWAKANPNWGVSVSPEDIQNKARKAMEMASATNNFLTKHLNVWVNADTAWMDMQAWDRCADPSLDEADFEGQECVSALDLASKIDIAANIKVFEKDGIYTIFGKYWLPEDTASDGANPHYAGWAREGRLVLTPGSVIDFAFIEDQLREDASRFDVKEVPYDPWQATYLATRMMEEGLPMVEYRQTVQNMSEPMKQLEALVLSGKLRHNGCPVLTWMISNVVAHLDAKDNIYPRKEFPQNKIDGVVALIMALGRIIKAEPVEPSVYENRGLRAL